MANGSLNNLIEQERRGLYNPKYNAKKNSLLYWESLLQCPIYTPTTSYTET